MPEATTTQLGKGSKLGYAAANATLTGGKYTYIDIPTVVSCNPGSSLEETENRLLSTDFLPYLPTNDSAEWSVTIQYVPADAAVKALLVAYVAKAVLHWELLFPGAGTHVIADGFIKSWDVKVENADIIEAEVSIRMNTRPVYEAVAA